MEPNETLPPARRGKAAIKTVNRGFKVVRIALTVIVALLLLLVLALFAAHVGDIRKAEDYVPAKFTTYLRTESVSRLYGEWIDLKATDIALASTGYAEFRKILVDYRSGAYARSPLVSLLLDCPADVTILGTSSVYAVFDLGLRGALTRHAAAAGPWITWKGLEFTKAEDLSYFKYTVGSSSYYLAFVANLAIASSDLGLLKDSLTLKIKGAALSDRALGPVLETMRSIPGKLKFLVNTDTLLSSAKASKSGFSTWLEALSFPAECAAGFDLDNSGAIFEAKSPYTISEENARETLARSRRPCEIPSLLDRDVSYLAYVSMGKLKTVIAAAAAAAKGGMDENLKKADDALRLVSGGGLEEMVYSWASAEAGVFQYEGSDDPVLFLRLLDKGAWEKAKAKLLNSIVLSNDSSLVVDSVRVSKINLPWYAEAIMKAAGFSMSLPYFVERGDYLFFSSNPAMLAKTVNGGRNGATLATKDEYAETRTLMPETPVLSVWYDTKAGMPFFLSGNDLLVRMFKMYGRGILSIDADGREISFRLKASGSSSGVPVMIAGFPFKMEDADGDFACVRFKNSPSPHFVWLTAGNRIRAIDSALGKPLENEIDPDSFLAFRPVPETVPHVAVVSKRGSVRFFDSSLALRGGVSSQAEGSSIGSAFLHPSGTLLLTDPERGSIDAVSRDGTVRRWERSFEGDIPAMTATQDGLVSFRPRTFDAELQKVALDGTSAPGWPQIADVAMTHPPLDAGNGALALVAESGTVTVWDKAGNVRSGFPVDIGQPCKAPPVTARVNGKPSLAILTRAGELVVMDAASGETARRNLEDTDANRARISAFDLDRDGIDEIYVYGDGARIRAYRADTLTMAPGFPLKGTGPVFFADLDNDGSIDVVTGGNDHTILGWSIPK